MTERANLVELDLVARRYGCRPSQVLGIENDWLAYQLDLATAYGALQEMTRPGWWRAPKGFSAAMRDPRGLVQRKMQIPSSGVW